MDNKHDGAYETARTIGRESRDLAVAVAEEIGRLVDGNNKDVPQRFIFRKRSAQVLARAAEFGSQETAKSVRQAGGFANGRVETRWGAVAVMATAAAAVASLAATECAAGRPEHLERITLAADYVLYAAHVLAEDARAATWENPNPYDAPLMPEEKTRWANAAAWAAVAEAALGMITADWCWEIHNLSDTKAFEEAVARFEEARARAAAGEVTPPLTAMDDNILDIRPNLAAGAEARAAEQARRLAAAADAARRAARCARMAARAIQWDSNEAAAADAAAQAAEAAADTAEAVVDAPAPLGEKAETAAKFAAVAAEAAAAPAWQVWEYPEELESLKSELHDLVSVNRALESENRTLKLRQGTQPAGPRPLP